MKHLLSSSAFIVVNKYLAKQIGINATILLSDLLSKDSYFEDDWFFNTEQNIQADTSLSPYQQRKALKTLKDKGFVESKRKGVPAKLYYKVNCEQVIKFLNNKECINSTTINNNKEIKINNKDTYSKPLLMLRFGKFGEEVNELSSEIGMSIEDANDFISYWSELNRSKTKMRFELEKTWETKRRLQNWMRNSKNWNEGFNAKEKKKYKSKVDSQINEYEKGKSLL